MNARVSCEADGAIADLGNRISVRADVPLSALAQSKIFLEKAPLLAQAAACAAGTLAQELFQPVRCASAHSGCPGVSGCAAQRRGTPGSVFGGVRNGAVACRSACPAGISIAPALEQLRLGNPDGAAQVIMQANPIPALTARLCDHPCEGACARGDSVCIHAVEQAIGDYALEHAKNLYVPAPDCSGRRVAILGVGGAGLTAAFYLRQTGCGVVLFASGNDAFNGRIPAETLRALHAAYRAMGVEFSGANAPGDSSAFDFVYDSAAEETAVIAESVRLGRSAAHRINAALALEEGHLCVGKQIHRQFLTFDPEGITRPSALCGSGAIELPQAAHEAERCLNCGCYAASPSLLSPALLALDAAFLTNERTLWAAELLERAQPQNGLRRGERLESIEIPILEGAIMHFDRAAGAADGSAACLASIFGVLDGRILRSKLVLGGSAPIPLRLSEAEACLAFSDINAENAERSAERTVKTAVPASESREKIEQIKALVRRAVLRLS